MYDYITGGEFVLSTLYSFQNDAKLLLDTVKKLMERNNGYITAKELEDFDISRNYLSIMTKKNMIEKEYSII